MEPMQLVSQQLESFLKFDGVKDNTSEHYPPSTNGQGERPVQTLKKALTSSTMTRPLGIRQTFVIRPEDLELDYKSAKKMTNLFTMCLQCAVIACLLLSLTDGNVLRNSKTTVSFTNVTGINTTPKLTHAPTKEIEERISQQVQPENRVSQIQTTIDTKASGRNVLRNTTESFNNVTDFTKSTQLIHVTTKEIEGQIGQQMQQANRNSKIQQTQDIKDFTEGVKADPIVAFTATTKDELTAVSKGQIVPFVDVITNIGGGYDSEVGVFRCPVRGLYQFTVTIRSRPRYRLQTQLFVGGRGTVTTYSDGGSYYDTSTNTLLIQVNRWENVYVRVEYVSTSGPIVGLSSTFSGYLIRKI